MFTETKSTIVLDKTLYDLTQNVQGAVFNAAVTLFNATPTDEPPRTPPALMQFQRGYAESTGWIMMQAAEFDPEPLSVERFRVRAIWSSPRIVMALLDLMAAEDWFDRIGDEYHLTDEGRALLTRMRNRTAQILTQYQPKIAQTNLDRLESLLRQVIDSSLNAPTPPGTWCLAHSRKRAIGDDAPALLKIIEYCSDINAVRDDAHMAAFKTHNIEAYIWESLAFVCDGNASDTAGLFAQMRYRGYAQSDYAYALEQLAQRSWIRVENGLATATEMGLVVRAESERLTDQYFYAPWQCLSGAEITELHDLLQALKAEAIA